MRANASERAFCFARLTANSETRSLVTTFVPENGQFLQTLLQMMHAIRHSPDANQVLAPKP